MSHIGKSVKDIEKELIKGYQEMSEINLEEANISINTDNEAFNICISELTECE